MRRLPHDPFLFEETSSDRATSLFAQGWLAALRGIAKRVRAEDSKVTFQLILQACLVRFTYCLCLKRQLRLDALYELLNLVVFAVLKELLLIWLVCHADSLPQGIPSQQLPP
jgi:hypothetical protein